LIIARITYTKDLIILHRTASLRTASNIGEARPEADAIDQLCRLARA